MTTTIAVPDLLKMSQTELDDLFKASQSGPIPDGPAEGTAIIAAGPNPHYPRYSLVLIAGLSADATYRAASRGHFPAAEAVIFYANGTSRELVVTDIKPAN